MAARQTQWPTSTISRKNRGLHEQSTVSLSVKLIPVQYPVYEYSLLRCTSVSFFLSEMAHGGRERGLHNKKFSRHTWFWGAHISRHLNSAIFPRFSIISTFTFSGLTENKLREYFDGFLSNRNHRWQRNAPLHKRNKQFVSKSKFNHWLYYITFNFLATIFFTDTNIDFRI